MPVADRFAIPLLLAAALGLWAAGITLPVLKVTKLFLWTDEIVLWRAIRALFQEGEPALGFVIAVFTLAAPLAKLAGAGLAFRAVRAARAETAARRVRWVEAFGKWSMLDVFVIAVAIFVAKSGWQAEASARAGLYCYAASALLATALALRIRALAARLDPSG